MSRAATGDIITRENCAFTIQVPQRVYIGDPVLSPASNHPKPAHDLSCFLARTLSCACTRAPLPRRARIGGPQKAGEAHERNPNAARKKVSMQHDEALRGRAGVCVRVRVRVRLRVRTQQQNNAPCRVWYAPTCKSRCRGTNRSQGGTAGCHSPS